MKMKANDYIAEFLRVQGIKEVFELTGGMITQLLDAIHKIGYTQIISMHHEQAAAFAADAYGRCTGKPAIAFATSGPGATNLITGIASCYFDSSPAIFITGQVNTHEQKGKLKVRQLGFQETDIATMTETITKKTYRITDAQQFVTVMKEAYEIAISDRPGPVLIDIPMNMQRVEIEVDLIKPISRNKISYSMNHHKIEDLIAALKKAERPLILAGGGVNAARARTDFLRLVDVLQIPVVTSLQGVDSVAFNHPLRAGFIGTYGNRWANIALGTCDLLLVIGSRLDIRQTGSDVVSFGKNKRIFHVDCDSHEINNRVKNATPIVMDIIDFIEHTLAFMGDNKLSPKQLWLNEIAHQRQKWPDTKESQNIEGINPNTLMHALSQCSQLAAGYVADVGSHQMWAAQSLEITDNQFFMTSGGMGAMGFALPAAIGASLACQRKPIVVIAGDGGFQLNIQELQTIVRNKLPLKIIVVNNNCLGMIRQFQDNYFDGRYQSTYWGYSAPNFTAIAEAYGIEAKTLAIPNETDTALTWFWQDKNKPALLQVMVDFRANAYPKIAFGKPITEMEPLARPKEMEGT